MKRLLVSFLALLFMASLVCAASLSWLQGPETTWASGSSLTSGSSVLGAVITYGNPGYPVAWCNFAITYSGTPTAGQAALVWFRVSTDNGATYPSVPTAEPPHMIFPFVAGASPQLVTFYVEKIPPGTTVKPYVTNDATGVTFTTWSLKCKQQTLQSS